MVKKNQDDSVSILYKMASFSHRISFLLKKGLVIQAYRTVSEVDRYISEQQKSRT